MIPPVLQHHHRSSRATRPLFKGQKADKTKPHGSITEPLTISLWLLKSTIDARFYPSLGSLKFHGDDQIQVEIYYNTYNPKPQEDHYHFGGPLKSHDPPPEKAFNGQFHVFVAKKGQAARDCYIIDIPIIEMSMGGNTRTRLGAGFTITDTDLKTASPLNGPELAKVIDLRKKTDHMAFEIPLVIGLHL